MHIRTLIVCALCLLAGATDAVAHSKLSKSSPADGGSAKIGLSEIRLAFTKPVRVMLVKVRNTDDKSDVAAEFKPAKGYENSFPFTVSPLAAGAHEVKWTAVAKDGHVMKGTLSFKVVD